MGIADGQEGSCAPVTSVGQLTGPTPYYGNPKVRADFFDLTTGESARAYLDMAPERRRRDVYLEAAPAGFDLGAEDVYSAKLDEQE